jgi:hypothetical protein
MSGGMNREQILTTATGLVNGPRKEAYGAAEPHFTRVAAMWSQVFGVEVQPYQVPMAMMLLKMDRANFDPSNPDHWVDMSGYSGLGGEVATMNEPPESIAVQTPSPVPATGGEIDSIVITMPPEPIDDYADVDTVESKKGRR